MDLLLRGKRVILAGGTRGIGREIARALAAEGCELGILARGRAGLEEVQRELGASTKVVIAEANVIDAASHEAGIAQLFDQLGGCDIAIANAGGSIPGDAATAPDATFLQQWQLHCLAAEQLLRAVVPGMRKQNEGSIVFISSISGLEAFGHAPYVSSKAALHGLCKAAARELGSSGIRVNCVAPGSTLFKGGSWDRRLQAEPERWKRYAEEWLPYKRFGTPEEVANVVTMLVSPRSSWVSGAIWVVDGAQSHSF